MHFKSWRCVAANRQMTRDDIGWNDGPTLKALAVRQGTRVCISRTRVNARWVCGGPSVIQPQKVELDPLSKLPSKVSHVCEL